MVFLIIILKDYRRLEGLLLGLVELGVTGATVLEGRGLGQFLGSEMPLFLGMRGFFPGSAMDSQLVVSVIKADLAEHCLALAEHQLGPLEDPGHGIAFTIPIGLHRGIKPDIS